MSILQDFLVANGNFIEIFIACAVFFVIYKDSKNFWIKFAALFLVVVSIAIVFYVLDIPKSIWFSFFKFLFIYVMIGVGGWLCTKTSPFNILFCIIAACAMQHGTFRVYSSILALIGIGYNSVEAFFIICATIFVVYSLIFFGFVRRIMKRPDKNLGSKIILLLAGAIAIFALLLQFIMELYVDYATQPVLYSLISIYDIVCCAFTLGLEYSAMTNKKLVSDMEILQHLIHKQEEQYKISKENIEMINIKCHDMKHQISRLSTRIDEKDIKEIKDIIKIYDFTYQTGNEVLDIILAEKGLFCENNGIYFDCIADGKCIDFMSTSDIYTLFGNALDNAIEAVCKVEEKEKRVISMKLTSRLGLVTIHIENYYLGTLSIENDLPQTTKEDKKYHGFGMRSIQLIVQKYKGNLEIQNANSVFCLNISMAIPGNTEIKSTK